MLLCSKALGSSHREVKPGSGLAELSPPPMDHHSPDYELGVGEGGR